MEEKVNILNEIKESTPFLASMERKNPFSVPENYFSILEKKTVSIIMDAPGTLDKNILGEKELPFEVPKDYFSRLPEHILDAVDKRDNRPVAAKTGFSDVPYKKYGSWIAAASVALIMTASAFLFFNRTNDSVSSSDQIGKLSVASSDEDSKFLSENISDVDELLVDRLYIEQSHANVSVHESSSKKNKSRLTSSKLKEYEKYMEDASDIDPSIIENN